MASMNVIQSDVGHTTIASGICPPCLELDLRSLLSQVEGHRKHTKPLGVAITSRLGTAILFRTVFSGGAPLQSQCWVCVKIQDWRRTLPVNISKFSRLHGVANNEFHDLGFDEIPRKLILDMPGRKGMYLKYRSRPRSESPLDIDFGVDKASGSSQGWLPRVGVVGKTINHTIVRSWLGQCVRDHDRCKMTDSVPWNQLQRIWLFDVYERRLVRYTQSSSPQTGGGEGPSFIALSYMWGGVQQPTLSPEDKVAYKLPLTIEHAILIVQELGYQFIWVDSLCINQSSTDDKMQQIAHMDSIYRLSVATIIVLDSADACSGIPGVFSEADNSIPFISRIAQIGTRINMGEHEASMISLHPTLNKEVSRSAWSKRAWTYQEGLLSRRRIILSRHQVYFSCSEMEDSEDHPTSLPSDWSCSRVLVNPLDDLDMHNIKECNRVYMEMVSDYTPRLMSEQNDGLNAINAVLAMWERKLSSRQFIFGLPVWAFRYALIWKYPILGAGIWNEVRPIRRDCDLFPSWSWCGWEHKRPVQWNFLLSYLGIGETRSHLPSTISVTWNDRVLVRDCHEEEGENDIGTADLSNDPAWTLLKELTRPDRQKRDDSYVNSRNKTFLRIRGILIQLPFIYNTAGLGAEPYIKIDIPGNLHLSKDVDAERLVVKGQYTYYDWVIVAMSITEVKISLWGKYKYFRGYEDCK